MSKLKESFKKDIIELKGKVIEMILIVAAMHDEVKSITPDLKLLTTNPFYIYEGIIKEKAVKLIITGVGKVNAASGLSYAICHDKDEIELIINIGFAGGFDVKLHAPYLIHQATYSDFDLTHFGYKLGQVPKFPQFYESSARILDKLKDLQQVMLYTQDHFQTEPLEYDAHLVDMEGTALFQIAALFQIDMVSLKVISDLMGKKDQMETYQASEVSLTEVLKDALEKVLEVC